MPRPKIPTPRPRFAGDDIARAGRRAADLGELRAAIDIDTVERIGDGERARRVEPDEVALDKGPVCSHAPEKDAVIGVARDQIAGATGRAAQHIGTGFATEFDPRPTVAEGRATGDIHADVIAHHLVAVRVEAVDVNPLLIIARNEVAGRGGRTADDVRLRAVSDFDPGQAVADRRDAQRVGPDEVSSTMLAVVPGPSIFTPWVVLPDKTLAAPGVTPPTILDCAPKPMSTPAAELGIAAATGGIEAEIVSFHDIEGGARAVDVNALNVITGNHVARCRDGAANHVEHAALLISTPAAKFGTATVPAALRPR